MKVLVAIVLISNLVLLWFCVLKDNVHITFGEQKYYGKFNTELPESTLQEDQKDEQKVTMTTNSQNSGDEEQPIVIKLSDLRVKVKQMVHEEYQEMLSEKDTVVEKTDAEMAGSPTLDKEGIDKAFSDDNRTDSIAVGQSSVMASPDDDDESVPSFGQLDDSMKVIGNSQSSSSDRDKAVETAMTITDTNIVLTLPEPLHSRFRDAVAEYQAKQIENESEAPKYKITTIVSQPHQELPENLENFNIRNYKRH